jgi:hypothetical protein
MIKVGIYFLSYTQQKEDYIIHRYLIYKNILFPKKTLKIALAPSFENDDALLSREQLNIHEKFI